MYISLMFRTQIYLPEELIIGLRQIAAIEDISVSELIRKNLKKSLRMGERKTDLLRVFVGKGKAKIRTDAVKEINSYYKQTQKGEWKF